MTVAFTINTSYRYFALAPETVNATASGAESADLFEVVEAGTAVVVFTGVRDGRVRIRVVDGPVADPGDYEDEQTGELDVQSPLHVVSWFDEDDDPPTPAFVPQRPGRHHVQVRARGRRDHEDESVDSDDPVESYEIALWSAA